MAADTTAQTRYPDRDVAPIITEDIPDDPEARFWSVYNHLAKGEDENLTENWDKDMDVLLIYSGLFSAVVTAFLIEGYKNLQPDSTLAALQRISQQLAGPGAPVLPAFERPASIVWYNTLWFISLVSRLFCALGATLVKQWGRDYLHTIREQATTTDRARVRSALYQGILKCNANLWIDILILLLHTSVFLFFAGLALFLMFQDGIVTWVISGLMLSMVLIYVALSVAPLFSYTIPFRTPLSLFFFRLDPFVALLLSQFKALASMPYTIQAVTRVTSALETVIKSWRKWTSYTKKVQTHIVIKWKKAISFISHRKQQAPDQEMQSHSAIRQAETNNSTDMNVAVSVNDVAHHRRSRVDFRRRRIQSITKNNESRDDRDYETFASLIPLIQYEGYWEALLGGLPSFLESNKRIFRFESGKSDNPINPRAFLCMEHIVRHCQLLIYSERLIQEDHQRPRTRIASDALVCLLDRLGSLDALPAPVIFAFSVTVTRYRCPGRVSSIRNSDNLTENVTNAFLWSWLYRSVSDLVNRSNCSPHLDLTASSLLHDMDHFFLDLEIPNENDNLYVLQTLLGRFSVSDISCPGSIASSTPSTCLRGILSGKILRNLTMHGFDNNSNIVQSLADYVMVIDTLTQCILTQCILLDLSLGDVRQMWTLQAEMEELRLLTPPLTPECNQRAIRNMKHTLHIILGYIPGDLENALVSELVNVATNLNYDDLPAYEHMETRLRLFRDMFGRLDLDDCATELVNAKQSGTPFRGSSSHRPTIHLAYQASLWDAVSTHLPPLESILPALQSTQFRGKFPREPGTRLERVDSLWSTVNAHTPPIELTPNVRTKIFVVDWILEITNWLLSAPNYQFELMIKRESYMDDESTWASSPDDMLSVSKWISHVLDIGDPGGMLADVSKSLSCRAKQMLPMNEDVMSSLRTLASITIFGSLALFCTRDELDQRSADSLEAALLLWCSVGSMQDDNMEDDDMEDDDTSMEDDDMENLFCSHPLAISLRPGFTNLFDRITGAVYSRDKQLSTLAVCCAAGLAHYKGGADSQSDNSSSDISGNVAILKIIEERRTLAKTPSHQGSDPQPTDPEAMELNQKSHALLFRRSTVLNASIRARAVICWIKNTRNQNVQKSKRAIILAWLQDVLTTSARECQDASSDDSSAGDLLEMASKALYYATRKPLVAFFVNIYGMLWCHSKVELLRDFADTLIELGCDCNIPVVTGVVKTLAETALQAPQIPKYIYQDVVIPPTSFSYPSQNLAISLYENYFAPGECGFRNKAGFSDEAVKAVRALCEKIAPDRLKNVYSLVEGDNSTEEPRESWEPGLF